VVTGVEMLSVLQDPAVREGVKRALDLPTEPVAQALRDMAAAQARTDASVEKLAAAQARTDARLDRLADSVERLAEAQARTDATVQELAAEIKELAAAQTRTERAVLELRQAVGSLSDNVGFSLEELAGIVLPAVLEREHGVTVERFARRFIPTAQGDEEVDLYADARRHDREVVVVGEIKSRIYPNDVRDFARKLERLAPVLPAEAVPVLFGFMVHPRANREARERGILAVGWGRETS
jgi:hypothetical protein